MDLKLLFLRIRNWADLDELPPLVLPKPPGEAIAHIEQAVQKMPLWRVEASDPVQGTMHLTRTTRLFKFTDDIRLKLEPVESGTRLRGRSQSRVGLSDLGQNRRNLRQLIEAVRA